MKEKRWRGKTLYICEICGLGYLDRETAQQCEEWCGKTGSCSVEITKKAVFLPDFFKKRRV